MKNMAGLEFWGKNVLKFCLSESIEDVCWRGREGTFHAEGLKMEKGLLKGDSCWSRNRLWMVGWGGGLEVVIPLPVCMYQKVQRKCLYPSVESLKRWEVWNCECAGFQSCGPYDVDNICQILTKVHCTWGALMSSFKTTFSWTLLFIGSCKWTAKDHLSFKTTFPWTLLFLGSCK